MGNMYTGDTYINREYYKVYGWSHLGRSYYHWFEWFIKFHQVEST